MQWLMPQQNHRAIFLSLIRWLDLIRKRVLQRDILMQKARLRNESRLISSVVYLVKETSETAGNQDRASQEMHYAPLVLLPLNKTLMWHHRPFP